MFKTIPSDEEVIFLTPITVQSYARKSKEKSYAQHTKTTMDANQQPNVKCELRVPTENGAHPTQFVQNNAQKDSSSANMKQLTLMDAQSNQIVFTKGKTSSTYTAMDIAHQSASDQSLWFHLDFRTMVVNYHLCAKYLTNKMLLPKIFDSNRFSIGLSSIT